MAGLQLIGHDVMDTSRLHAILTAAHQADRADTASPGPGEQHRSRMQHGLMGNTGASSDSGGASIPLSELALLSQLQGLNPANAFLQPGLAVQGQAGQLKLPIGLEELSKMGRGAVGMGMGSLGGTPVQSHSHKPTRSTDSRSSSAYASRHQAAEQRRRTRINERCAHALLCLAWSTAACTDTPGGVRGACTCVPAGCAPGGGRFLRSCSTAVAVELLGA